jgi:hypothetical protein
MRAGNLDLSQFSDVLSPSKPTVDSNSVRESKADESWDIDEIGSNGVTILHPIVAKNG